MAKKEVLQCAAFDALQDLSEPMKQVLSAGLLGTVISRNGRLPSVCFEPVRTGAALCDEGYRHPVCTFHFGGDNLPHTVEFFGDN